MVAVGAVVNAAGLGPPVVSRGIDRLRSPGGAPSSAPAPSTVLLAVTDTSGGAMLALFGKGRPDAGSVLLIPGSTQVEVPSLGSLTLARTLDAAGAGGLGQAVENALGVGVGAVVVADAEGLRSMMAPAGPFEVRLRAPADLVEGTLASGVHRVTSGRAADLVLADGPSDLDDLVAAHAVLEGWFAALARGGIGVVADTMAERAGADVEAVRSALESVVRRARFDVLDVVPVGVGGDERYGVADTNDVASLYPVQAFTAGPRPRVEIRNGLGTPGLAGAVAAQIVPKGFEVVLTGNAASFGVAKTLIVVQDAAFVDDGERLREALAVGELRMARDPVSVVDLTIVVGSDFHPGGE
jgi:hypothetical protein